MRVLLAAWRLLRIAPHVLHAIGVISLRFRHYAPEQRHAYIQGWSAKGLRLLGITLQLRGAMPDPRGMLLVANHVSWLDIAAIHAVLGPARFVSKADVKHWPVLGAVIEGAGTLFIERSSKRDALRVVHQTAAALQNGDCVAIFPEGTTGPGPALLPFHANLLQAAISVGAPLLPLVLRWHEPGERFSPTARYIGDTTLGQSLWRIASARGLGIEIQVLDAVATAAQDRRALSAALHAQLAARL